MAKDDRVEKLGRQILMSRDPVAQAGALAELVFDLFVEIQALRQALADIPEAREKYRKAYASACVLAHNSAGVTPGFIKVMHALHGVREGAWLKRLGATDHEIAEFEKECRLVETYT